jgi:hypothetical protein
MNKYYHYTAETKLKEIIDSGLIKVSTANTTHKKEKPCAWVSSNPFWEHTSTKSVIENGKRIPLTFEEQLAEFGCARIQVKPIGFYTWAKLRYKANFDLMWMRAMEESGIESGGNPKEWFGSLVPIKKENWLKIEVIRNGMWVEYNENLTRL